MESLAFCKNHNILEAGCDEAGRGCLAGPVVAAAVILKTPILGLNDSKKLTETQRNHFENIIKESASAYSVAYVWPQRIDGINILNASIEAMHIALNELTILPEFILIDGNRFHPYLDVPHECVIGGDGKYQAIAAASILAKTERDRYMNSIAHEFPNFQWQKNKGYPTSFHTEAIIKHGPCIHHRKSFGIVKSLLVQSAKKS